MGEGVLLQLGSGQWDKRAGWDGGRVPTARLLLFLHSLHLLRIPTHQPPTYCLLTGTWTWTTRWGWRRRGGTERAPTAPWPRALVPVVHRCAGAAGVGESRWAG